MMKRLILCALCLVMAVSACLAEGIPEKSNRYKASMFKEIPEKTVKKEFTQYMAPGYKIEYDTGRAWCPDLIMSGEGCYETYYEITDNERVRICREIAEKLFRTVYPDTEPEVLTKGILLKRIHDCEDSAEAFLKTNLGKFAYVEAQLWYRP